MTEHLFDTCLTLNTTGEADTKGRPEARVQETLGFGGSGCYAFGVLRSMELA